MNTVEQMSAHHLQPAPARFRKAFESFRGRPDPMGIHRENGKRAVLPLDNPVKRCPRGLRNVKKNQRLASHGGRTIAACVRSAHFSAASGGAVSKSSPSRPLSLIAWMTLCV